MTRQIQVPDDLYKSLCLIAEARGHKVSVGRSSGMVATLREMADLFKPLDCGDMDEAWSRFFARIMPTVNELSLAALHHREQVDVDARASKGLTLKRVIK